jgi:hypothetical protein
MWGGRPRPPLLTLAVFSRQPSAKQLSTARLMTMILAT